MHVVASEFDHLEIDQELFDLWGVEHPAAMKAGIRPENLGIEMNRDMPRAP